MVKKSPKKKGRKGKGKGKKSAKNVQGRSFYESRVTELQKQLEEAKTLCTQLEHECDESRKLYENERNDKDDIASYLQLQNRCQEAQMSELNEDVISMKAQAEQMTILEGQALVNLDEEAKQVIAALQDECDNLQKGIDNLSEYEERKSELEKGSRVIMKQLEHKRALYAKEIYFLERRLVETDAALKSEMKKRVDNVSAQFRAFSNSQLKDTTKQAIIENKFATEELTQVILQTRELLAKNEALRSKVALSSKQLEIMEKNNITLKKKKATLDKENTFLGRHAHENKIDLEATQNVIDETLADKEWLEDEITENHHLEDDYAELLGRFERLQKDQAGVEAKLAASSQEHERLGAIIDKATLDLVEHENDQENRTSAMPHLLPVLAAASAGTVKKTVQKQLGNDSLMYQNGALGMVSKE